MNTIPDWHSSAVLPAIDFSDPASPFRSPYEASTLSIVARFGQTSTRRRLLMGLLDFRVEMHKAGLVRGFQWLDGSFAENVEVNKGREPGDIDLVTFFCIPDGYTQRSLLNKFPNLFNNTEVKTQHGVDAFFVSLNQVNPESIVRKSSYWHGLFSHRRDDFQWKGYVQIDLATDHDADARRELEALDNLGGQR